MLILYVALPQRLYFSTIGAILAKLYANSLLVMFNSRIRMAGSRNWPSHARGISSDLAASQTSPQHGAARAFNSRAAAVSLNGIHVQEQVVVHTDEAISDERVSAISSYSDPSLAKEMPYDLEIL